MNDPALSEDFDSELYRRLEEAARSMRQAAEDDPLRAAFLARGLSALLDLCEQLGRPALGQAVAATSDPGVLLSALSHEDVLAGLVKGDPLQAARVRGVRARRQLLDREGGSWGVREVATHLGISRQAVDKRRRAGRLLALRIGRHGFAYPAWQFASNGVLAGLVDALAALEEHDAWMMLAFFVQSNDALGGESPLHALRGGRVDEVMRAAHLYGEQIPA